MNNLDWKKRNQRANHRTPARRRLICKGDETKIIPKYIWTVETENHLKNLEFSERTVFRYMFRTCVGISLWIVESTIGDWWTHEHLLLNKGFSNTQTKLHTMRYQKYERYFIYLDFVIRHPVFSVDCVVCSVNNNFVVGFYWFKYNFDLQSERNTFETFPNVKKWLVSSLKSLSNHPECSSTNESILDNVQFFLFSLNTNVFFSFFLSKAYRIINWERSKLVTSNQQLELYNNRKKKKQQHRFWARLMVSLI